MWTVGPRGLLRPLRALAPFGRRFRRAVSLDAERCSVGASVSRPLRWFRTAWLQGAVGAGAFRDVEFLAVRGDGFGPRLGEMLNAWRIARALSGRFVFAWPETGADGAEPPAAIFSERFIARHLLTGPELAEFRGVATWRIADLVALKDGISRGARISSKSNQNGAGKFAVVAKDFDFPAMPTMADAYWAIELTPRLEEIRRGIRDGWEGSAAAIHVRRGDVVTGDHRLGGRYAKKALPAPLVRELAHRLGSGRTTLVVGNDLAHTLSMLDGLAVVTPAQVSPVPCETLVEQMVRDITAISCADVTVAGKSMFARAGALIGGKDPVAAHVVVPKAEARRIILDSLRKPEASGSLGIEASLSCEYVRNVLTARRDRSLDRELLGLARRADPTNPSYVVAMGAVLARNRQFTAAQELFESALGEVGLMGACVRLFRAKLDFGPGAHWGLLTNPIGFLRMEDWDLLEANVGEVPAARPFLAAQRSGNQDGDRFRGHAAALARWKDLPHASVAFVAAILEHSGGGTR